MTIAAPGPAAAATTRPWAQSTGDSQANHNTQASINYYLGQGVPASQLVFGVPFYGYDFPVSNLHTACPSNNCGATTYVGYLAAAADVGNGWTRYWDASASSPYLISNSSANTITYDDAQSIQAKSTWALNTADLGGVFMWELSGDYTAPSNQPLLDAMRAPAPGLWAHRDFHVDAHAHPGRPRLRHLPIPSRIQAEDYSASYDDTPGNTGGAYRTGDTDIEATTDVGGGYDVGYIDAGEWLEFQVQVAATGVYDFSFRVASAQTTAMDLSLALDGTALGGSVNISGTGGWQTWATDAVTGFNLSAGRHTLRVLLGTGGFNLNYVDVSREATPTPSITRSATVSSTATATRSLSPSATRSSSPSATRSNTPSVTDSATVTATLSPTPSFSASQTVSPSPSVTVTVRGTFHLWPQRHRDDHYQQDAEPNAVRHQDRQRHAYLDR